MDFNFFDWLRNGVKNSVLHGVNDAVNTMGMPPEETNKDKVLGWLKNSGNNENDPSIRRINGSAPASTKKLGRSLSDIAVKEAS
jgi:hypothetical protein